MRQNLRVVLTILFIFALGMIGQYRISPDAFVNDFSRVFYQVIMLFGFEGDWTLKIENLPFELAVTRVLAPLAVIFSLVYVFARETRYALTEFMIRFNRDHIVVGGLGDKAWQFIQTCHPRYKVVAIEIDPSNPNIENARKLGISVLVADVLEERTLKRANLLQAKSLVTLTGSDGTNVELALKARSMMSPLTDQDHPLRIHLHVDDTRLMHRLENYPKFFEESYRAEVRFFSLYDLSARILLSQYPVEVHADAFRHCQGHVALYGFNRLAEHILVEAARMCHLANGVRLKFTVFDVDPQAKRLALENEHNHLSDICDLEFLQLDFVGPRAVEALDTTLLQSISQHVICYHHDEDNLNAALSLRAELLTRQACNSPIMVRMQQSRGLAMLLESGKGTREVPDGLYPFGMLDQVLHADHIIDDNLDQLARAYHRKYLVGKSDSDDDTRLYSTQRAWNQLPELARKSNLLQGDHLAVKLRAIRAALSSEGVSTLELTDQEAELWSSMEQQRYVANARYEGWRYGPERIEGARLNPNLRNWSELDPGTQQEVINNTRELPDHFAREVGLCIQRELVIGVTGHRLHGMNPRNMDVHDEVLKELQSIRDANPHRRFVVLSSLAEGADRLVAKLAMSYLNARLRVPLPLPYELYIIDFQGQSSVDEFKELIGLADRYFELPMKFGNQQALATRLGREANSQRDKQYALAGAYIVENSDELIAIYNGEPEKGIGGTGQIVRWRELGKVEEEFQTSTGFFLRPTMSPPRVIKPRH